MSIAFPELAAIRLGFGLSPLMPPPADAAAVMADVAATAATPATHTMAAARQAEWDYNALSKVAREEGDPNGSGALAQTRMRDEMVRQHNLYLRNRLAACAGAPIGFGERLVQFWANHFTVTARIVQNRPGILAFVDEAIRPNIGGSFLDLFTAAETHPAMLIYLDQVRSIGDRSVAAVRNRGKVGLNENLAREMLELHSLGVGADYTQDDVHQLANLLTGLSYDAKQPDRKFFPDYVQPGAETVLGRSYGGSRRDGMGAILQAFADLAGRPETARFIAHKLARHFIMDEPDPGLVGDLAAAWGKVGDLPAVYGVLIDHPQLAAQFRGKVRQPFDFLAAGLRGLGFDGAAVAAISDQRALRWLHQPLGRMGQPWLRASGPDGWGEGSAGWINPQLLAARIDWAMNAPRALCDPLPDARALMQAALGPTASDALRWAVPRAESQPEGVGVVLASNDFNRR